MRRLYALLALLLLAASITSSVGCSSQAGSNNQLAEMLKLVPDTPETRHYVLIADYAQARELYSIGLPGPDADESALMSYIVAIHGQSIGLISDAFLSGMGAGPYASVSPIRRKNVGFGPQDVDIVATAGKAPMMFEIIKGRFNPGQTADAIQSANSPAARQRYSTETYRGVAIHSWGSGLQLDLQNTLSPPVFDRLGRAQPMAVLKEYAFRYTFTDGVRAMIDLSNGDKSTIDGTTVGSLGEAREYKLLAEGLRDLGAYSVFLSDHPDQPAYAGSYSEPAPHLRPYQAYGWGTAKDEQGVYAALVLVHASSDLAAQNVERLRRRIEENSSAIYKTPWKSMIPAAEIKSDGTLLLAKLRRPEGLRFGLNIVFKNDSLLLEETR